MAGFLFFYIISFIIIEFIKKISPYLFHLHISRSHEEVGVNAGTGSADCVDLFLHIIAGKRNIKKGDVENN